MTAAAPIMEPLSMEYQAGYHDVLRRMMRNVENVNSLNGALGRHFKELVIRQLTQLDAAAAGSDVVFDTREAAYDLYYILRDYIKLIKEKLEPVAMRAVEDCYRLQKFLESDHYRTWTDEDGRRLLEDASVRSSLVMLQRGVTSRDEGKLLPLLIATLDAIKLSTPTGFQFTIYALWDAYASYYQKATYLRTVLIPNFDRSAKPAFEHFATVDARRAELRQRAVEKAQREQEEQAARDCEAEEHRYLAHQNYSHRGGAQGEAQPEQMTFTSGDEVLGSPDTYEFGSSFDDSSDDYGYNPANGLPMVDSVFDCHMNVYGTDQY